MSVQVWKPHVVVAAVIEARGRFLLVEEETDEGLRLNQPAGHLEAGESLLQAVRREVFEETAHHFEPRALLGIYRWVHPRKEQTFLRFAFTGELTGFDPHARLDEGILRTLWLSPEEIRANAPRHRSPLLARCLADYLAGRSYPLELLNELIPGLAGGA